MSNIFLATESGSIWTLLGPGGQLIIIPLGLLFFAVIFFCIERLLLLNKIKKSIGYDFMSKIRDFVVNGNLSAAKTLAKKTDGPVARMIDKGLSRIGKPIDAIEKSMENVGKLEIYKMEKNLGFISLVSRLAPLFGFVGTIIGLIILLQTFVNEPNPSISSIAGGMYVKLISSAAGLIIGLLSFVIHHYLNTQINIIANKMESASNDFIDILQEPTRI